MSGICVGVARLKPGNGSQKWKPGRPKLLTERGPRIYPRLVVMALLVVGLLAAGARGQDVASITGTVTDKTGAPISDAHAKLVDTRTGACLLYTSRCV